MPLFGPMGLDRTADVWYTDAVRSIEATTGQSRRMGKSDARRFAPADTSLGLGRCVAGAIFLWDMPKGVCDEKTVMATLFFRV